MFGMGSLWKKLCKHPPLDPLGAWVDRQQDCAVIAKKCSAAQALALRQMKEPCPYGKFGLSWGDFCQQHAGISRVHVDHIIRQYEEFGEARPHCPLGSGPQRRSGNVLGSPPH